MSDLNTVTISIEEFCRFKDIEIAYGEKWNKLEKTFDDRNDQLTLDYENLRSQLETATLIGRIMAKWFFKK